MPDVTGASRRAVRFGRYELLDEIASGGMVAVYLARPEGQSRTVEVKRPHFYIGRDPDFASVFVEEARLASRVRHVNVVSTLDVIEDRGEVGVVTEHVRGESLEALARAAEAPGGARPSLRVAARLVVDALEGLHAAHEATDEAGRPLGIVHRDVSPQNILVGADGVTRVADFGIARAASRVHHTTERYVKGRLAYVAPEHLSGEAGDRRADVYSAAVILWELVAGRHLFVSDNEYEMLSRILLQPVRPLREARPDVPAPLAAVVDRGLARDPAARFADARAMARELGWAVELASNEEVAAWAQLLVAGPLAAGSATTVPAPLPGPDEAESERSAVSAFESGVPRDFTPHGIAASPSPARRVQSWSWLVSGLVAPTLLAAVLAQVRRGPDAAPEAAPAAALPSGPRAVVSPLGGPVDAGRRPAGERAADESPPPASEGRGRAADERVVVSSSTSGATPATSAGPSGAPTDALRVAPAGPSGPPAEAPAVGPSGREGAAEAAPPRRPHRPKRKQGRPASCDPPYAYDLEGVRRVKPWCL
jgi:serine/threonine-protein kinase